MLYILFSLIVLVPVLAGFGAIFTKLFGAIFEGISALLLTGILSVTVIWTIAAFLIPLDIVVEVITLAIGLSAFFYFRCYLVFYQFLQRNHFHFLTVLLVAVFFASFFPFIFDHFGYYVPTINWLSKVGLVQGISNLDLGLGQMSSWHVLQAGFSHFSDPFLRLNIVPVVIYFTYIFEKKSWLHLIFVPVLFLYLQSPSPDLPVIIFGLIVLNELLKTNNHTTLLFLISVFVFSIKPTMIWLPLLVFGYALIILKSNFKFIVPGTALLFLFFFKNIWTFGFPVFPVQYFDFDVSWKPNTEILRNSSEIAVRKTFDMQYSYSQIKGFSTLDYLRNWLFIGGVKGFMHQFFVLTLIVFFIYALIKKSKMIWLIFISIFIKCVLVLLFSAQYRFFMDVYFVVFFVIFYEKVSRRISLIVFAFLSIFAGTLFSFPNLIKRYAPSFYLGSFMGGFNQSQFHKPSVYELKNFKSYKIRNLEFNVVNDYPYTFDTPLPAISPHFIKECLDSGIFPQCKRNSLEDGFIWRKITVEENNQVKKIVDDFSSKKYD